MAKKRTTTPKIKPIPNAYIEKAGIVEEERITDTLEKNYMPYAMSVIISRALPEIDGFKPSHRKLLYTMYKMGLLNGGRTKSANVVGQTMRLNPHGDSAILTPWCGWHGAMNRCCIPMWIPREISARRIPEIWHTLPADTRKSS